MRRSAITLLLAACGSTAPSLRPIDQGDDADRVIAIQDNYVTLIERASDPLDAASALRSYCKANRAQIDGVLAKVDEHAGDAAFAKDLQARSKQVVARLAKVFEERPDFAKDKTVAYALRDCDGRDAAPPDMCQRLVSKLNECAETMPPAERDKAHRQVEELAELDPEACLDLFKRARATTASVCPDVVWE